MKKDVDLIKKNIEENVFTKGGEVSVIENGVPVDWIFDFKSIILTPEFLTAVANVFTGTFKEKGNFQVGGLEITAIPLVAAIVMEASRQKLSLNGFFIRKSRKKNGLMNQVEGNVTDEKIILVDDILNSGKSFIKQVEILESMGKKVDSIFVILRYRDISYYKYFLEKGIKVESIFTLDDFRDSLGVSNLTHGDNLPKNNFEVKWYFKSEGANYFYVIPKSAPVLDEKRIYFGSDSGYFWALDQENGKEAWKFKISGPGSQGKTIFSSPAIFRDLVYFGAYDGNFYALEKETGEKKWIFTEADWIGSSPCVAEDLEHVYVGLEFGFWKKKGGIAALDAISGKKKWEYFFPGLTHGSPAYSKKFGVVIIGSNDGGVYAFKAKTGELIWEYQTGAEVRASFAFEERLGIVAFGSHDGKLYIVDVKKGKPLFIFDTGTAIYSTPLIHDRHVFVASLNKILYCLSLDTYKVIWQFQMNGRIFSSPVEIGGSLYIGSNDAILYELNPKNGEVIGMFRAIERIVNKIVYNPVTKRFFVPTFANEVFCLEKKTGTPNKES